MADKSSANAGRLSKRAGDRRGAVAGKLARPRRIEAAHHSLAAIVNLVRSCEALTRQEIEGQSRLGRAVVADRLDTLARLGLCHESSRGRPSGGRAPRLVQFSADVGLVLVAVLDLSTLSVGIADLRGRLLIEHHEPVDLASGPVPALNRLGTLFDWMLEQRQGARTVWGIGIAVPGPIEPATEKPFEVPNLRFLPNWHAY